MTEYTGQSEIDFDISDSELIPTGTHDVIVQDAEIRQGPKAPYINVTFEIRYGDFKGTYVWEIITLSPNPRARAQSKRTLETILGRPLEKEDIRKLVSELKGRACRVILEPKVYEGQTRPEVIKILPLSGVISTDSSGSLDDDFFGSPAAAKTEKKDGDVPF